MNNPQPVILASSNTGKQAEIQHALAEEKLGLQLQLQTCLGIPSPEETGTTFVENAIIKARHAARVGRKPALADDSGLMVEALAGAPGVYSAVYAGNEASDDANNLKLLADLSSVAHTTRRAAYVCVMVFMRHGDDPLPIIVSATWSGEIGLSPQGKFGFGYDPLFWVASCQCTAAEMTPHQKNAHSHRGQALRQLVRQLKHVDYASL